MVCRVVRAKLFQYLDEELSPYQRAALERHLASCPDCQRRVDLERTFWGTYIVPLRPDPAPEEVREQVVRLLDALPSRPPERQKRYLSRHSLAAGIALILLGGFLGFGLQRLWQRATAPLAQLADAAVEQHQKLTRTLLEGGSLTSEISRWLPCTTEWKPRMSRCSSFRSRGIGN